MKQKNKKKKHIIRTLYVLLRHLQVERCDSFNQIVIEDDWLPDPRATNDPSRFRVNTWEKTYLGKSSVCVVFVFSMCIDLLTVY